MNLNTKSFSQPNENKLYFNKRVEKLKKILEEKNFNNYLIFKDENIFYFSGFFSKNSKSILVVTEKEIYLIVHFIYYEFAKKTTVLKNLKIIQYQEDRNKHLESIFSSFKSNNVAIEGKFISYEEYINLSKIAEKQKKILINLSGVIEEMRAIKDEVEISNIKKACNITDKVINKLFKIDISEFKKYTEIELSNFIEAEMIKMKSYGRSFDFVIANNENSSLPHHRSDHKRLSNGILLIDIGCIFNNYCSDITRTIFLGRFPYLKKINQNNEMIFSKSKNISRRASKMNYTKLKEIYNIVLNAQTLALDKCKAGISCKMLDSIAREYIVKSGYGDNFGHGLGHGIGLEVHEIPKISSSNSIILEENMVVTIEPAIYIEGLGGVRIEDMILIKNNGFINLYSAPKTLTVIN